MRSMRITVESRQSRDVVLGASLRAATHVLLASKTFAALQGRDFVTPDDIRYLTIPVLDHRLILRPEYEIEGLTIREVIQDVVRQIEVPR